MQSAIETLVCRYENHILKETEKNKNKKDNKGQNKKKIKVIHWLHLYSLYSPQQSILFFCKSSFFLHFFPFKVQKFALLNYP